MNQKNTAYIPIWLKCIALLMVFMPVPVYLLLGSAAGKYIDTYPMRFLCPICICNAMALLLLVLGFWKTWSPVWKIPLLIVAIGMLLFFWAVSRIEC